MVTGASGVIGVALTTALLDAGYSVIAFGRYSPQEFSSATHPNLRREQEELLRKGAVDRIVAVADEEGGASSLVHLARSKENLQGPRSSRENWLAEYELSVLFPYELIQRFRTQVGFRKAVLAGSIYGLVAQRPDLYKDESSLNPHYGAAKAAVTQLVRDLAVQLAPACQVNSVAWGGIQEGTSSRTSELYGASNPSGRMLTLGEVVSPVLFLLGDGSSGITGHTMVVDGGWTSW